MKDLTTMSVEEKRRDALKLVADIEGSGTPLGDRWKEFHEWVLHIIETAEEGSQELDAVEWLLNKGQEASPFAFTMLARYD